MWEGCFVGFAGDEVCPWAEEPNFVEPLRPAPVPSSSSPPLPPEQAVSVATAAPGHVSDVGRDAPMNSSVPVPVASEVANEHVETPPPARSTPGLKQ
eukprot:6161429-Pyramimonas_sp.AAC.1